VWIWAAAAAAPTEPDAAALEAMLQEQLPQLGAQVGRQPVGNLRLGVLTREQLLLAMVQPPPHFSDRTLSVEIPSWADEHLQIMQAQALAVYVPSMQGIYLVQENLEEVFRQDGLPAEMLTPLVRCLVAHEIVHALQHQYGTRAELEDADLGKGWEALAEGHATLEGMEWCEAHEGPVVARMARELQGIDSAGTMDPGSPTAPYGLGEALVRTLRQEDPELVWAALSAPAPSWTAIVADIRPMLGAGWEDPAPVREALAALGVGAGELSGVGLQPIAPLVGASPWGMPGISASWLFRDEQKQMALLVARSSEAGTFAPLLDQREQQLGGQSELVLAAELPEGYLSVRGGPATGIEDPRLVRTLRVRVNHPGPVPYREHWLATDRLLVVLAALEHTPALRHPNEVLVELLQQLPDREPAATLPAEPALAGWLQQVRAVKPSVLPRPAPGWLLADAARSWKEGERAPCSRTFADVLVSDSPAAAGLEPWTRAAYLCAVGVQDLAVAERAAARLPSLEPLPAARHAWMLLEEERVEAALAVLDRADRAELDADETRALVDARLAALGRTGSWEAMAKLARQGGSPELRLQVAEALEQVGRGREAREIRGLACAEAGSATPGCR
jgi:hypothetical protein